jgi:hypothetical protein
MENNTKDECVEALNFVIGKFGYSLVASTLHDRMKQDYAFMKKYFDEKKVKAEPKTKVREVVEVVEPVEHVESVEVVEAVEVVELVEPVEIVTAELQESEVKVRTPKEIKEWQKAEEDKKRKEQEAKGIKPKDLLTKENKHDRCYQTIAGNGLDQRRCGQRIKRSLRI